MLPIIILNNIIIDDEERKEVRRVLNQEKRMIRSASDPFYMTDEQFVVLFRLTKQMVNEIIFPVLIPHLQKYSPLAVPAEQKILLALNFYATGTYQNRLGLDWKFPVSQQMMSNIINEVTPLIVNELGNRWVQFPTQRNDINRIKAKFMEHTRFPGVLGAIDCTHVPILAPKNQEHNYLNRKGYHSKNVQIVCDYDLRILNINARFGGAAHDAFIFRQSTVFDDLLHRYNQGETNTWLLGDSGYPQKPFLMTPILNAQPDTPEGNYTFRHIRARVAIERLNGVFKAVFRCLSGENKLRYKPDMVGTIINACAILHNIRIQGRLQNIPNNDLIVLEDPVLNENNNPANLDDENGIRERRLLIQTYFQ